MADGTFKCECVDVYFGDNCEKGKWKLKNTSIFFYFFFFSHFLSFFLSDFQSYLLRFLKVVYFNVSEK